MFVYNYRIFDKYDKPVASFAILADRNRQWRPNSWGFAFAGSKHTLVFSIVKLVDYEPKIDERLTLDNMFGLITAAHLLTQQTRRKNEERYHAKLRLIRLLYERQWERKHIVELLRVIDWFLELPKEFRQKLKTEICQIEEQKKMKYVTSFERDALEEGFEKGIVEGVLQGRIEVARNLMASGFSTEQAASIANVPLSLLV